MSQEYYQVPDVTDASPEELRDIITTLNQHLLRISTRLSTVNFSSSSATTDYSNITQIPAANPWRTFYSNAESEIAELALNTSGKVLTSNGASSAPSWQAVPNQNDVFNVADYDEGSDTLNLQAAVDDAEAVNGTVYIPATTFAIDDPITIEAGITITGYTSSDSTVQQTVNDEDIFQINTTDSVTIKNLRLRNSSGSTATAGAAIYVTGNNGFSHFSNLRISAMYRGIYFYNAGLWTLEDSYIVNNVLDGVRIEYANHVDTGDSTITRCTFDNSDTSGTYAIYQVSSGGLRVINSKILGHEYGYYLNIDNSVATSVLLIECSSIENYGTGGIKLVADTGETFEKVIIAGNEFSSTTGTPINIGEGGGDFTQIVIANNTIRMLANAYGIVLNVGDYFTITGNELYGNNTGTAIGINANCTYGNISGNIIANFSTYLSNSSSSVIADGNWTDESAIITAAGTISVPLRPGPYLITGGTAIGTINGGWPGRIITLVGSSTGAPRTITDGSGDLRLAGNFSMGDEDTITLQRSTGNTAWYELSRSTN